jgi:hypothetical protein
MATGASQRHCSADGNAPYHPGKRRRQSIAGVELLETFTTAHDVAGAPGTRASGRVAVANVLCRPAARAAPTLAAELAVDIRTPTGLAVLTLAAACSGCGYYSEYVPLAGGPARPVWRDDRLVMAAAPAAVDAVSRSSPDVDAIDRPVEPPRDARVPSVHLHGDVGHGAADATRAVVRSVPKPTSNGLPRGGGGGGKDAAVVLVVGVLVALPIISVALATGVPEDEKEVTRVIAQLDAAGGAAPGELRLRYSDGLEVWSGPERISTGYGHEALEEAVACVPRAREHARAARSDGATASTLSVTGIVVGVTGASGLAGLAVRDRPALMATFFGTGLLLGATGVVLAATSRGYKNSANGHAVDALAHYNDAMAAGAPACVRRIGPAR